MKKENLRESKKVLSPKIFCDAKRSRILWHDAKIFGSASMIYFQNMLSGVYGKTPEKLKEAICDLQAAAALHLITLENNSILQKIELGSLSPDPIPCTPEISLASACRFLEPLTKKRQISIQMKVKKKGNFPLDQRYGSTIIQNMLMLAGEFLEVDKKTIFVKADAEGIEVSCKTEATDETLDKKLSINQIYNEKSMGATLPALMHLINSHFALLCQSSYSAMIRNKTFFARYEQSQKQKNPIRG